jgi:hypothetical protein
MPWCGSCAMCIIERPTIRREPTGIPCDESNRDEERPHPAHSRPAKHQLDQMCVHTGDCEPPAIVLGGMILSSKEIMRGAK